MHQSGHSRAHSMQTVQLLSSRAMTPRLLGGSGMGIGTGVTPGGVSVRRGATAGVVRLDGTRARAGPSGPSSELGLAQRVTLEAVGAGAAAEGPGGPRR